MLRTLCGHAIFHARGVLNPSVRLTRRTHRCSTQWKTITVPQFHFTPIGLGPVLTPVDGKSSFPLNATVIPNHIYLMDDDGSNSRLTDSASYEAPPVVPRRQI